MKAIMETIKNEVNRVKEELGIEDMTWKEFAESMGYGAILFGAIYMMSVLCYIFQ